MHAAHTQCTPRTRALMVVSPHNPTGLMPGAGDWEALAAICRRRGLALVVDEVFCETLARGGRYERPAVEAFPLVLTLNGLSKMLSLPGWKVGWMKVDGAPECVAPLLEALDHLNDTFLPLPDLQQAMIPALLDAGERGWFAHLAEIISRRREAALRCLEASGFVADACPAGVYLCVQLDEAPDRGSAAPDEGFALRALLEAGVLVHPGSYYSLPSHWVMTCITGEDRLEDGIRRLAGMRPG